MILDNLDLRNRYRKLPSLFEALEALSLALTLDFPSERLVLDGERLYINPLSLNTVLNDAPFFETHQRYLDVHCMYSGEENILIQSPELLTPTKSYDLEGDYSLYQGPAKAIVTLKPGDFLVCFPQDAHAPGLCVTKPENIRKLVAKILIGEEL